MPITLVGVLSFASFFRFATSSFDHLLFVFFAATDVVSFSAKFVFLKLCQAEAQLKRKPATKWAGSN